MRLSAIEKQKRITKISILHKSSILDALKQMDLVNFKLLVVTKDDKYFSVLSIGDIQRGIIKKVNLKAEIESILRPHINVCSIDDDISIVKEKMYEFRSEFMPIVNSDNEIVDFIFWDEFFDTHHNLVQGNLDVPVVLMAGGQGTRLKPITNIIPKALVPIGEDPILKIIVDRFCQMGAKTFHMSVNYKAEMIIQYFDSIPNRNYDVSYFEEPKPLGTCGSLFMLKGKINSTFFVSNCDIILDQDYAEIYNYHVENKHELTIVAAVKHLSIPYGTVEMNNGGLLKSLKEKPELTFMVNTGMYVLEPHLLDHIPENEFFHITDLIEKIVKENGKVGVFPVSEGAWMDIGEWKEYDRTQEIFKQRHQVSVKDQN